MLTNIRNTLQRTWRRSLLHMAIACAVISTVSSVFFVSNSANTTTVTLIFLLLVLACAALWGLPEAIFASAWSMVCLNYHFLPPLYSMGIDDPQNWVSWIAFLITALVASDLSTRSKNRALEAMRRQSEIERMYALSCRLMLDDNAADLARGVPEHVAQIFAVSGVAYYDKASAQIHLAGTAAGVRRESLIRTVGSADIWHDPGADVAVVPVNLGSHAIGTLGFEDTSISQTTMQSIANLVAMAMDRARKQEVAGQAEAARRHQELKSMLLDALAHEFQTPLTSIRAAIGAMLSESPAGEQREWLEIMEQESDRLSGMMAEAIQMARIEAGHVDLDMQAHTVADLVGSALRKEAAEPSQIQIDVPEELPAISADAGLIRLVLRQIVGNALKYSPPGTLIRVSARIEDECAVIRVADQGPGIAEADRERIFEKYYRGQQGRGSLTGMGMGLPIARQVIEAHGGRLWVESPPGQGATFSFTLPFAHEEVNA